MYYQKGLASRQKNMGVSASLQAKAQSDQQAKEKESNHESLDDHKPRNQVEQRSPSEMLGILHLAIKRRVAPIQGHDGGDIMVLHKVGILAKLVFLDDEKENQVQVDKLRAALGVLHSNDPCVYVVHDYNARGIPGTRQVKLLFASKNVLRSSVDV